MRLFSIPIVLFSALLFYNGPQANMIPLVKIYINGGSYLKIHGKTNLNRFHCQYIKSFSDTLSVRIIKEESNKLTLENAGISLNVLQFDCGNDPINRDFQRLLRAEDFPTLKIEALGIESNEEVHQRQKSMQNMGILSSAHIRITIAGKQNDYYLAVNEPEGEGKRTYSGSLQIDIRDFELTPPRKLLGLMQVNEKVNIDVYLKLSFPD